MLVVVKPIANADATTMDEMNSAYSAVIRLLNIGEQIISIAFIIL
jgi:hypothetical protein